MATNPFQSYISNEFLEQQPRAAYLSSPFAQQWQQRSTGVTDPSRKRFYQSSFQDVYNDYLAQLGTQARGGEVPSMRFRDYLEADPFTERFSRLTPMQKGIYGGDFNPRTRQIYY